MQNIQPCNKERDWLNLDRGEKKRQKKGGVRKQDVNLKFQDF